MSQGDVYVSREDGERINPATKEGQAELLAVANESIVTNSLDFGTQYLTLNGSGLAEGGDQPCRTCLVTHSSSNAIYMGNSADGNADAESFLLPPDVVIEVPVRNTNKLSFFGTAADTISILWRD